MPIEAGTTLLGKYRVLRQLGAGGMGRVWLAEESGFDHRQVAIKEVRLELLKPDVRDEMEARFQREIDLSARLSRIKAPHVVTAITSETLDDDTRLLVMEYAPGESLAELIAAHPKGVPVEQAVRLVRQVCLALAALHSLPEAPVHRDVKPSNILLSAGGEAQLSDFGLAQLAGTSSGRTQMTAPQHPGTPLYMAPEQASNTSYLSPAADVYTLGCVLFELLTGKRYKNRVPGTLPSAINPAVPPWLDAAVTKALAQNPWDRYESCEEFASALSPQASAPIKRSWVLGAALAAVAILLIGGAWFALGQPGFGAGMPPPTLPAVALDTVQPEPSQALPVAAAQAETIVVTPITPFSSTIVVAAVTGETPGPSATTTDTPQPTATPTETPQPTATGTVAIVPAQAPTEMPAEMPIVEPMPSATQTPSATPTTPATSTAAPTLPPTATVTVTPLPTDTATPIPTPTPVPTATNSPDLPATATAVANILATSVVETLTAMPTATPTPPPTATFTPTPNLPATETAVARHLAQSVVDTLTAMPTATPTPLPTATFRPTPDLVATEVAHAQAMATAVAATLTAQPTATPTSRPTSTSTPTPTANPPHAHENSCPHRYAAQRLHRAHRPCRRQQRTEHLESYGVRRSGRAGNEYLFRQCVPAGAAALGI